MSKETKFQSVASFCADNKVDAISKVRMNTSGYPFITMVGEGFEGGGENIYFSREQAKLVKEGQEPADLGLASLQIAHTENADGDARLKISGKGDGGADYTNVSDLLG